MIEQWVIGKLNLLKGEKLTILADPQGMIRAGARAVDGWAKDNGFTVLFCSGNLALRELYENLRDDASAKLILVDRTRDKAKLPLFYPDLEAHCQSRARLTITLRDFLTEKTGHQRWPLLVGVPGTPYSILRLSFRGLLPFSNAPRPWLRSRLLTSEDSAKVLFERRQELLVAQKPARMPVGTEEFDVLFANHPGEEAAPRRRQLQQRTDTYERVVLSAHAGTRAAPPIAAPLVDPPGARGVERHAPHGGQQVRLFEDAQSEPPPATNGLATARGN